MYFKTENFDLIIKLIKEYGDFVRVWLGPELNIVISDPKDVEVNNKNIAINNVSISRSQLLLRISMSE